MHFSIYLWSIAMAKWWQPAHGLACLLISSSCYFFFSPPFLNFRLFVLSNVGARQLQPINTPRAETIITTSDTASLWHATAVSSRRGRVVWVHRAKFNTKAWSCLQPRRCCRYQTRKSTAVSFALSVWWSGKSNRLDVLLLYQSRAKDTGV